MLSFIDNGCLFCGSSLISNSCLMACAVQREDGCETAHFAVFVASPLGSSLDLESRCFLRGLILFLTKGIILAPFSFSQQQWKDCRIWTDGAGGGHGCRHGRANAQFIQFQLCCAQCGSSQSRSIQLGNNAETGHGSRCGCHLGNCGMHPAGLRRKHLGLWA